MNWNPFKKNTSEEPELDPLNLTLSHIKPGYVLDYDLKTWQVKSHAWYDYDGDRVDEWELVCGDDLIYLERAEDDGITWNMSRKVRLSDIDGDVRAHMRNSEDPPETVAFNGTTYYADSSDIGRYFKSDRDSGDEFIVWEYLDTSETKTLCIEQWGDDEYEAAAGEIVEEYQFTNILPVA